MNDYAVRVNNISKQYFIGKKHAKYETLRDTISDAFLGPLRRAGNLLRGQATGAAELDESLWALRDVTFDIKPGEVVGIIGRNGAGKSTLLKVLSRITQPTKGTAEIHGRVGSLLEVGTGFHAELTGRENIFLNGAILGMRKTEIHQKFDEIVDFSEIEKFLDTPVKHYSSGMIMRLAFAVAAHLEPEVLIVDEVLAVGDVAFQRKCLDKMEHVGKHGRTVLFVSHNMPAITRLCERVILLDEGSVLKDGVPSEIVGAYLHGGVGTMAAREWEDLSSAPGDDVARLRAVRVINENNEITEFIDIRHPVEIEMEFEVFEAGKKLMPFFLFYTDGGVYAFAAHDVDPEWRDRPRATGNYICKTTIPGNFLSEGTMFVSAGVNVIVPARNVFFERDAVAFQVVDSPDGDTARGDWAGTMGGAVRPMLKWMTRYTTSNDDHLII